ncbi:MAG TPA: squalene synthase HpnC [Burkholderiales bacterium]
MSVGHYENFPVASLLLPAELRVPVAVIYRFARSADDIADEGEDPPAERLAKLQAYHDALERLDRPETPLFEDVAFVIREFALSESLFHDLIDAFAQDVVKKRYADFTEVLDYCKRSANPVGRLLLELFKQTSETELDQSDAICTALQLVNFWQDVAVDYAKGRIYLPQDEMAAHGVSEAHIAEQRCDDAWRALMAWQVERTRALMLGGAPLGAALTGRIGLEIRTTVHGGLRVLEKIEAVGYDVFRQRPVLKWFDWPLLLMRAVGRSVSEPTSRSGSDPNQTRPGSDPRGV